MDGILPLYKAAGMTSHDCVAAIRKILHMKRVGHSGTLDPQVDGVLPICLGQATKAVDYLLMQSKVYTGTVLLGKASETEDLEGAIIATEKLSAQRSAEDIKAAMAQLTGDLIQIPPMYSAVKVNGKRLYDYARQGLPVKRPQRPVHVYRFDYKATAYDAITQTQTITFEAEVSKGTYIRTLAVDLGKKMGLPALMSQLTRTASGGFSIDQTVSLADFEATVTAGNAQRYVFPLDHALSQFANYALSDEEWAKVQNGGFLEIHDQPEEIALSYQNNIKALYHAKRPLIYQPVRMFLQNEGV